MAVKGIAPPSNVLSWSNGFPLTTDDGVFAPVGRAMANGSTAVLVTAMEGYISGQGGSRQARFTFGLATTAWFGIGAGSSAGYVGPFPTNHWLVSGTESAVAYECNGAAYFGYGGSGTTRTNGGGSYPGTLAGAIYYAQAPTAPRSPSVLAGSNSATLSWVAPSDNGDSSVVGYRVQYSTAANFAGATTVDVGTATSYVINGLTPGSTYYFRVAARNAVTAAAGTSSVYSSAVSATLGAAPSAPAAPTLAVWGNAIEVSWSAPSNTGGAPIIDYALEYSTAADFAGSTTLTVPASTTRVTLPGLTPGATYYVRVKARNSIGSSPASPSASAATAARTPLDLVRGAAVSVDGAHVSIRSDGAASPTLTLGYVAFGTGTAFVPIAVLPTGTAAGEFAVIGGAHALALAASPTGDLYVIGADGAATSSMLVKRYAKTGPLTWAAGGSLSQALPSTGNPLAQFAAAYTPGSGASPVPTLLVLARRAGTVGVGGLSYAALNLTNLAASSGALFLNYGSNPSWLAAPPSGQPHNSGLLDAAPLTAASNRVAILADGFAVVEVTNGTVIGVSKAANGSTVPGTWARVIGINATTFATLTVVAGALTWTFYGANGAVLGSGSHPGANAQGGAFGEQWDAYFNRVTGQLVIYYVANADARTVESISVSPATYAATAPATVTAALGAASSVNEALRLAQGASIDERRVLVEAVNDLAGALSTAAYGDTAGNQAPSAPTLAMVDGFDASLAQLLAWTFGDPNPLDTQGAYEIQVQRVSDSVLVVNPGKVVASGGNHALAADALVNGVDYRWRVRTYDALDAAGAWSAYDAFTTSALGTLTITAPATDNPAGVDVSSYLVTWDYAQGDGYTQAQRRVRVLQGGDVLSDSTMQPSTEQSYTVSGLPSDVELTIEVSIITNAPGSPTVSASRLLTTSYASPMTPEVALDRGESYVIVTVTNPPPSGARPEVVANDIERRASGTGANFMRIATVEKDGVYFDHAVASGASYDYRARGVTA